ncbi:PAS domain S-box-containing protein [Falsiroseomonas stagni DSM 19981]|uniref:Sensory/regulatory protein RpfC n=1 Tax=Falsiroseomonas stagni DSM 19981 TaxID=1123062 RepID=A0A1I4DYS8_9PROT|nr:PAS domain S-box-containing protein [Falsiroseomonas stagni DSM 19981]
MSRSKRSSSTTISRPPPAGSEADPPPETPARLSPAAGSLPGPAAGFPDPAAGPAALAAGSPDAALAAGAFPAVLAAAAAAAPTGIVIADPTLPDCPIIFANPAFHRITGYPPEAVIGRNCRFLQGPGTDPAALATIRAAVREARPLDIRLVNYRRDGRRFVNELHLSPVFGPDGALRHILGIQHDVTERVAAEQAARTATRAAERARRAAERASEEKSEFLAFMSHEVRTPLNGVLGTLSLLTDTTLDAEQRAYVDTARRCGDTLLWTVNEILDLSRIEAGRLVLEEIAFDLDQPVRDVLALQAAAAAEKGIGLCARIDPGLPKRVVGDPQRLRQVLMNLADNAVKFTAAGAVEIRLARFADRLVVEVQDSGCGISPSLRRRLFQRFQQADSGTARRHGGSGLGLMICRRLVGLMGGTIAVESEAGAGSVFRFDLPLVAAVDQPAGPSPALLVPDAPAPPAPRRPPDGASRGRLLLAEDGEASQLVAAAMLRRAGFAVDLVTDGVEAVAAAARGSYDVILMDVRMPGLDGYAATARIRALPGEAALVPILAFTAAAMPGDVERCLAAGMDGHLPKPVDREALVGTVAALMERRPRRPAPGPEPGPAHSLLDRATLEELRGALGPGRLPDLIAIFVAETEARLGRLLAAPALPVLEEEAHSLQAAAGTFGAAALREAALALEAASRAGDRARADSLLAALPGLVERSLAALTRAAGQAAEARS